MKKILISLFIISILCGCGSTTKDKRVVCKTPDNYSGDDMHQGQNCKNKHYPKAGLSSLSLNRKNDCIKITRKIFIIIDNISLVVLRLQHLISMCFMILLL